MSPRFWRGVRNGLPLSLALWALILWVAAETARGVHYARTITPAYAEGWRP